MSTDLILEKLIRVVDETETNNATDEQWDSYSDFSWRFAFHCISKMTSEEQQNFKRELPTFEAEKDLIRYICNYKQITSEIDSLFNKFMRAATRRPPKNEHKAAMEMKTGMNLMQNSHYTEAAETFSKAIENFAMTSEKFGECLKSRGMSLYKCNRYEEAYKDIVAAIDVTNSKNETIQLLFMKSECLRHLGRSEESDECWKTAERELRNAEIVDDNSKRQIVKYFKSLRSSNVREMLDEEVTIPTYEDHHIFGAPKFVEISSDDIKGRTLKTSVDIPKGSIVMSENATVTWLSPCNYSHCCNFCLKKITNRYIPCRSCTFVKYCSLICESKAWKQYHSVECPFLDLLKYCSSSHLSLRILIIFGFDRILKVIEESKDSTNQRTRSFPYSYKSFYSLVGYHNHMDCDQLFAFCVGALFVTKIAENMNLIQRDSPYYFTFAGIVLKHVFQTNINCFAVMDMNIRRQRDSRIYMDTGNFIKIGIAIYLGTSMASHSCDFNCFKYTFGSQLLYVANRDIKAGDEITITYCPHYKKMAFKDRQRYLKHHYHFDCSCTACINRWENVQFAYRCPRCSGALVWNADKSNSCINCGLKHSDIMHFVTMASIANENVIIAKSILDRNETKDVKRYLNYALNVVRDTFYSFVQQENAMVQLCRYYEKKKKYDKAFECCWHLTLIAREKNDDECLEGVSMLIKSVNLLVLDIELLAYFRRPVSLKMSKARELFSSCLGTLEVNQRQELPIVSKSYAANFRLIPRITNKLSLKSNL